MRQYRCARVSRLAGGLTLLAAAWVLVAAPRTASAQAFEALGDVNGDMYFDAADVAFAIRGLIGDLPLVVVMPQADVAPLRADGTRGDGQLSMSDIVTLVRIVLGLESRVVIRVAPEAAVVQSGASVRFAAALWNAPTDADEVIWTAEGGSIASTQEATPAALFTAGPVPGEYEVVATSRTDPTRRSVARVTVVPRPTLTVLSPVEGSLVGDDLVLRLVSSSVRQVTKVEASAGEATFELASDAVDPTLWLGTLSLVGLPRGLVTVTLTATDDQGDTFSATLDVIHDRKPTVAVAEPRPGTVVLGETRLRAECSDDDPAGCESVTVHARVGPLGSPDEFQELLTVEGGDLDHTLDLAVLPRGFVELRFTARDTAGQETSVLVPVVVEGAASLRELLTVDGRILDLDETRVLYLVETGDAARLQLLDRGTGQVETVDTTGLVWQPLYAALTSEGVLYVLPSPTLPGLADELRERREGETLSLGTLFPTSSLRLGGGMAAWNDGTRLLLRDLAQGITTPVPDTTGQSTHDLTPTGDLIYASGGPEPLRRLRGGVREDLAPEATAGADKPVAGTSVVVYTKVSPGAELPYTIEALTPLGVEVLHGPSDVPPSPGLDYQAAGDWIAFTRRGPGDNVEAWMRSPSGELRRVSSGPAQIHHLTPDGHVALYEGSRVVLVGPDGARVQAGSPAGWYLREGGQWRAVYGRTLFEVLP